MKLKYYIDKKGKKVYTLKKENPENKKQETKSAHYKFIERKNSK